MGGDPALSDDTDPRRADYGSIDIISDDETVIAKGSLDPVYESKAKVLNRAVRWQPFHSQLAMAMAMANAVQY